MANQRVFLKRDNQFGLSGPQAGDEGEVLNKFFLPGIHTPWYRVEFDDYPNEMYSCPEGTVEFIDPSLDRLVLV